MIPGKKYDPGTFTSRRPTPERFAHLRRWVEPVDRSISMTTIEEITNINQQLEQSSEFYISTIISRVIAHMVAAYNDGFVTLQATEGGALHVQTARETKTVTSAIIQLTAAGDNIIVAGVAGQKIKLTSLMFTVKGETNITFKDGAVGITGPMDFGGDGEPSGMVSNHGFLPYELTEEQSFVIHLSVNAVVSGYVTGYIE